MAQSQDSLKSVLRPIVGDQNCKQVLAPKRRPIANQEEEEAQQSQIIERPEQIAERRSASAE